MSEPTWVSDLAAEVVERLQVKYPDARSFRPTSSGHPDQIHAMIEWSEPVTNPKLKVRSLSRNIIFHADRCNSYVIEILDGTFPYADPDFPENLYRRLGV